MVIYTEGICAAGAGILKDGELITIEQVLKELNEAQKGATPTGQVDSVVIRQTLEREINSRTKSINRLVGDEAMEAAARGDAVREGLQWSLFVLHQELGV